MIFEQTEYSSVRMQISAFVILVYMVLPAILAEDVSYQACVDKYSRKGYQPWQEWSDHYTCHRYRCEIRDGKYFIAAVGCRKPKIPENALECHEYIEDENVEFPTCCARLRCVVEVNGERIVQTRGQPGELFPDKPWKGQQNEPNPAVVAGIPQNAVGNEPQGQAAPGIFNNRGAGKEKRYYWLLARLALPTIFPTAADGTDINGRRYVDPYPSPQIQDTPRKKRSTIHPLFDRSSERGAGPYPAHPVKINGYAPERYFTSYFSNNIKSLTNTKSPVLS